MNILVTGCAGFIGFHTTQRLLKEGHTIIGIDNLINYPFSTYRLGILKEINNFSFYGLDLKDAIYIFKNVVINAVIHLAAQAGVFNNNPQVYVDNNITGFLNILEGCKKYEVKKLLYASSSSVYGNNKNFPWKELETPQPTSMYGISKYTNEMMAKLYDFQTIGMRFFNVYGPYGRPESVIYKFTQSILEDKQVDLYNQGKMYRDFTYIDDVVDAILLLLNKENNQHEIYNIGNDRPVQIYQILLYIENCLHKRAIKNFLAQRPGEVIKTHADRTKIALHTDWYPRIQIEQGLELFINWYKGTV